MGDLHVLGYMKWLASAPWEGLISGLCPRAVLHVESCEAAFVDMTST